MLRNSWTISTEPQAVLDQSGPAPNAAPFANNCLLARRLAERGVRFIKLLHCDWDHHGGLPDGIRKQATNTNQALVVLLADLKQRGTLMKHSSFGATSLGELPVIAREASPRKVSAVIIIRDATASGWLATGSRAAWPLAKPMTSPTTSPVTAFTSTVSTPRSFIVWALCTNDAPAVFHGRDFRLTNVAGKVTHPI